jgi:hypothetical protein
MARKDRHRSARVHGDRARKIGDFLIPAVLVSLFEKSALKAAAAGLKRYSARDIFARLRWFAAVEQKAGQYKVNNNWSPALARWFLGRHPELPGFFETRERRQPDA